MSILLMNRHYSFVVYKAADGWRWRLRSGNNEIVADGAEAYTRNSDAKRAVDELVDGLRHNAVTTQVLPKPKKRPAVTSRVRSG